MNEFWDKVKSILSKNLFKNIKKLVERIGVWLIGMIELTIPVVVWLCGAITEPILFTAAVSAYCLTAVSVAVAIGYVFKNGRNGQNGNPQ